MATQSESILISKKSQGAVIEFYRQSYQLVNQQWNLRDQLRQIDLAYNREVDWTKRNQTAKLSNRLGDADKLQNIVVPVVLPAVESFTTYQSSVFLTGTPLFGVVSDPSNEDQALQLETILDDQAIRGGWVRELMMHFRDGAKYNIGALEVPWVREVTQSLENDITFDNGKQGKPKEVIWEGNALYNMDMYNTFWDSRVAPAHVHLRGEFAGYSRIHSRISLKQLIASLPAVIIDNVIPAFESAGPGFGVGVETGGIEAFYIPQVNPDAIINKNMYSSTNWLQWAGIVNSTNQKIEYKNIYQVTTLYARILPSDFGLRSPGQNTPQIWKFLIVNGQVVIYAERQTNAHQYLPMLFSQPLEDGLTYQTKSLATNVRPFQEVSTALMNSVLAARRRAISDRGLYDPSRVTEANINSQNPSAKIPIKPAAYGKPLSDAYFPIPFRDDQSPLMMQQIQGLQGLANYVTGQNQARQGQFVKGNKTLHEFDTVMNNANGRDQMTAMLYEAQLFTPLKLILKTNVLQYQGGIALFNRSKQQIVKIDPVALRNSTLNFKVSDGLTPIDKLINADAFQVGMQVLGSSPQIGAGYNITQVFSYLMKTQGADLAAFEKSPPQIAYEQAVQSWQQLVLQLAKAGSTPQQYPAQPKPQDYGFDPNAQLQQKPAPATPSQPAQNSIPAPTAQSVQ